MSKHRTRSTAAAFAGLAVILIAAAALRHQRIGYDAVSFDEMWHLVLSTGRGSPQMTMPANTPVHMPESISDLTGAPPCWSAWTHMDRVLHPPLFVLTMRGWRHAFGSGDLVAQWYVAAWSIAAILAAADFVLTLTRRRAAALWTAAILAVSPTQILLSQEVRAYPMLMGLACIALAVAARIETRGFTTLRAAALATAMLAMMLTHYFALGPCLAIAAWAAIRLLGRALAGMFIAFAAIAVVFAAAWGPFMIRQIPDISHTADPWLKDSTTAADALRRFLGMPVRLLVESAGRGWVASVAGAAVLVAAGAVLRRRRELLLPLLWFFGGCGFLLALDLARSTRHLEFLRYSLISAPAVAAMLVMIQPARWSVVGHVACAALVTTLLWLNPLAYADDPLDYADFRLVRRHMVEHVRPGEAMLFYSGPRAKGYFNEILLLSATREPTLFPRDVVKLMSPADAALVQSLPGETAWLYSGPIDDASTVLPGARVIEQATLTDPGGRFVAVCTRVALR